MTGLCRFVARTLEVDPANVTEDTGPLTLSAWDSFHHVHLMVALEQEYKVEIAIEEAVGILTVRDIARLLEEKGARVV